MKVKRLELEDFRSFRGRHVIDFTDPATGAPLDRVLLVGSNGCGKTSVLELFYETISAVPGADEAGLPTMGVGSADLMLELSATDVDSRMPGLEFPAGCHLEVRSGALRIPRGVAGTVLLRKGGTHAQGYSQPERAAATTLRRAASQMTQETGPPTGGVLFLPHDRQMPSAMGGPVEPPPAVGHWAYRYSAGDEWRGSLEQYWVWLNYLDLEGRDQGRPAEHLVPAIELFRAAMGPGREVVIREGRVLVSTPWVGADGWPAWVRLDQLPSGEKQCALLLGHIARFGRRGGILLIDELEISLHAALQRKLLGQLTAVTRQLDMQLIIATHSLELAQSVGSNEVIDLDPLVPSAEPAEVAGVAE